MNKQFARFTVAIVLLLSVVLLAARPTAAAVPTVKWVDQAGGNDANDGDTEATAYATLQMALDNSLSGTDNLNRSYIYVKNGTYTGSNGTSCEGLPGAAYIQDLDWLTIQAAAGQEPLIMPAAGIISVVVERSNHLVVDNIDSDQTVADTDNWHVCESDDVTLRNSHFEGGKDGIDFHTPLTSALIEDNTFTNINTGSGDEVLDFTDFVASGVVIQDNTFLNNYRNITINPATGGASSSFTIQRNLMNTTTSQEAIRLINVTDTDIVNNVIYNSQQEGIYVDTGCGNLNIWHNTFFNNSLESPGSGYGEIRTKVVTADISIKNNIFYANGLNPVFDTTVASLPGEDYNLVYNYTLSGTFTTFGANTITGQDPLFVSTTSGSEDLHLTLGSPAIEAAPSLGVTDDKDKGPRPDPNGTDPDMGAYEFGAPPSASFCPAENDDVGYLLTDLIGTGQGSTTKGYRTRKLVVPHDDNVASLYGQLAAVDVGLMKYVRFLYPDGTKQQIYAPTSPAYQKYAVSWWGWDLTPSKYIKGQFFWGAKGNKSPRAFVLWPTYNTEEQYANVFVPFDESINNHVAAAPGFFQTRQLIIDIPETQADGATVVVRLAIVDNDKDSRPVLLDVTVGSGTQSNADTVPNMKATLNLYTFTFENVDAGVSQVTIDLNSPLPGELYPAGGDSAAIIGAAVNYACEVELAR